jgi:hypothetical protein
MSCGCKDCRNTGIRIRETRRLYEPSFRNAILKRNCKATACGQQEIMPRCRQKCPMESCCDRYKRYWSKNCDIPCIKCYEDQPWIRDPTIQKGWADFVGDYVTPNNICCHLQPGPDDHQFKCNKVRALMGPQVCCTWDLPCQEECCETRYGYNRDWRRYNEDQRMKFSDVKCGCSDEPVCEKPKCEWPPYQGKMYGGRYMAWAHPLSFMFPRPRPYNYQSIFLPSCH